MMNMKSCIVIVVVSMCFYGTSALFFQAGGSAGGNGQLNIAIKGESSVVGTLVTALEGAFSAGVKLLGSLAEDTAVVAGSSFKLFMEPLEGFFKLFENVAFDSVKQFVTTFEEGLDNLKSAISGGWKLVADLTAGGNLLLAAGLGTFMAVLEGVVTVFEGLDLAVGGDTEVSESTASSGPVTSTGPGRRCYCY